MIRPEVKALFWRWREALFALGLIALGTWWAMRSFGIVEWLGWGLVLLGGFWIVSAVQRARFGGADDGPGIVTVDERRVVYMGPLDGGVADLDATVRLDLTPQPNAAWQLTGETGGKLSIPVNATGSEALFDAFSTLPGLRAGQLVAALDRNRNATITLWRVGRDPAITHLPPRVH